jgi:hypothetical protein
LKNYVGTAVPGEKGLIYVFSSRVDELFSPQFTRPDLFLLGRRNDRNASSHGGRELYGHFSQSAEPNNRNFIACFETSVTQASVNRQSRAHQGCSVRKAECVWEREHVVSSRYHELLVATIPHHPDKLSIRAQYFVTYNALFAMTTSREKPRNAYASSSRRIVHTRAEILNDSDNFVTQNDRELYKRKVTIPDHQVTVAHAARVDTDEYFPRPHGGDRPVFDLKGSFSFF